MENKKIIFVYNADSSLEHQVFDFLHKAISPSTYQCSLCAITYGTFTIKNEWKEYISGLSFPVEFLYRNQFRRYYPGLKIKYPAVMVAEGKELKEIIGAEELKQLELDGLMLTLRKRLAK
ncbi:hypothetical protein [Cesiribacter sp. SM1]|uniref:hypothetical protein n=1 Tax=Cesiribacter sp. SM1 TaxID=2861196 RepID=UPI001CD29F69|nr:hypothetical protein [Cesiribacter sp. SM1]